MELQKPDSRRRRAIQGALGAWFDRTRRKLPWREDSSPYHIWISEIMAQQTRLKTVEPYFRRFIGRFPTIEALARASQDQVLAAWSGLGYYSRARHLHRAARLVVKNHAGRLPRRAAELQRLPGIGRYTACAIASIAFGQPEPVLDGNGIRVLTRLFDLDMDTGRAPARRLLWDLAARLVPGERPGRFNEAVMELGAMVCTPRTPDCRACPLGRLCRAKRNRTIPERPRLSKKKPPRPVQILAALVQDPRGRILLVKNRPAGLFGGLWQLPWLQRPAGSPARTARKNLEQDLRTKLGIGVKVGGQLTRRQHLLTHRSLDIRLYACRVSTSRIPGCDHRSVRWITGRGDLEELGLATVTRRLLVTRLTEKNAQPGEI